MAIRYTKYPISSVDQICNAIVDAVESSGMYDSVVYDNGTITIADGRKTYLTIQVGGTSTAIVYTDNISGEALTFSSGTGVSFVSVATVGNCVMVTFYTGWRKSIILGRTENGINAVAIGYTPTNNFYPVVVPKDAASIEILSVDNMGIPFQSSVPIAILAGLVAASVSEGYASMTDVFRFVRKPTGIPLPWAQDATFDCQIIKIGDEEYLTDGYFCVRDR